MTTELDYILAIDIGGTKLAAALVDPAGKVHYRLETPTLAHEGCDGILRRLESLGKQVLAQEPGLTVRAIGAASAGQIDIRTGKVNYATDNLPGWNQLDLTHVLENLFGLPATADNDVNAMGVAEMHYGVGEGYQNVLCTMVGTGIGGAVIIDGELYSGILGGAGEFGHVSIQSFGGRPCNCGGTGCVEVYGSSRALLADFIENAGEQEILQHLGIPSRSLTIQRLAAAYQNPIYQNWTALQRSVSFAAEALGAGLATAVNLLSPELVVIAGSIQMLGEPYLALVHESLQRRAMRPRRDTRLCFSKLGADPGLVGAALLARKRLLS